MTRLALAIVAALVSLAAWAGPASGQDPGSTPYTLVDTSRTGLIDAALFGPLGSEVRLGERVGDQIVPLASAVIPPAGNVFLQRVALWRCDRQVRRFVASVTLADGEHVGPDYVLRTPSCRGRFDFEVPEHVRPGRAARIAVEDGWRVGGVSARLCIAAPGRRARCEDLSLADGVSRTSRKLRPRRKGLWRVELRTAGLRLKRTVEVARKARFKRRKRERLPFVLATGNSMMQTVDSLLIDGLGSRARGLSDARIATGLTVAGSDLVGRAHRQVARLKPDVTVVLYGGPDGYDLTDPAGQEIKCCSEPWVVEYSRRARDLMIEYARDGQGAVLWLTMPAPRSEAMREIAVATNDAVRRASRLVANVHILALERVFTPGFEFRPAMRYRGRTVTVRSSDGVHFTLAGARIAASLALRRLKRLKLLEGR